MKSVKNDIESFSFVYLVLSVFMIIMIVPNVCTSEVSVTVIRKLFNGFNFFGMPLVIVLVILYLIEALYYYYCYYLLRNITTKSYKYVYFVIVIGILFNSYSLVMNFSLTPLLGLLVSVVAFCFVITTKRKELRKK